MPCEYGSVALPNIHTLDGVPNTGIRSILFKVDTRGRANLETTTATEPRPARAARRKAWDPSSVTMVAVLDSGYPLAAAGR